MLVDIFHDFENNCLPKYKKIYFKLRNFVPFIVYLLLSLDNYWRNKAKLMSSEGAKGIGVTKSNVFNEFVMTLLAWTRNLHKI